MTSTNTPAAQQEVQRAGDLTTPSHDSHGLPMVADSSRPALYLPPLLSSLPESLPPFPVPATPEGPAFLTTETRLPYIDPVSLSLHKALRDFKPLSAEYASTPYAEAFNWADLVLPVNEERAWYCVAFRSMRKPGSDSKPLYDADAVAHEEAISIGGLIAYWYGVPHPKTAMNLATCIWESQKQATAARMAPHHVKAMELAGPSYEHYIIERHVLRKVKGETGLRVEPYHGGEVGW